MLTAYIVAGCHGFLTPLPLWFVRQVSNPQLRGYDICDGGLLSPLFGVEGSSVAAAYKMLGTGRLNRPDAKNDVDGGVWPDVFDGDWGNLTKMSKSHWTL